MTSIPIFRERDDCKIDLVPRVDFDFVENCEIPKLPPPTLDCPPPLCPFPEPPIFCPTFDGEDVKVKVTSRPAGCPPDPADKQGGKITVTQKSEDCQFSIGLDLTIPLELPPCPIVSLTTKTDKNATEITGTVTPSGGECGAPECKFEIEISSPPIPTIPEIKTTINTFIETNINTFIDTYLVTNIDTFIDIVGPTIVVDIITNINNGNICVPKYKGGKIEICESEDKTGEITITENKNTDKYCQTKLCKFSSNTVAFGDSISDFVTPALVDQHKSCPAVIVLVPGQPATVLAAMDACWCAALSGTVTTECENISQEENPEQYCADKKGTLFDGPCGQTKKCPDLTISGKICIPPAPCQTTYLGGDIAVSLSSDPDAQPEGKISIGAPTKYRSCLFLADSPGFNSFSDNPAAADVCVPIVDGNKAPGIGVGIGIDESGCTDLGGTLQYNEDCATNCDEKEVSASLTLPQSLCDIEFEAGDQELTPVSCGGDTKPTISVSIVKSDAGKYKIDVTGTYCDCCNESAATVDGVEEEPA